MYTSDTNETVKELKTGMIYLVASLVIAAAAAEYGLFSHGVYSYWMTYAFMVPLLLGAMPHLISALKSETRRADGSGGMNDDQPGKAGMIGKYFSGDIQLAVIAALTAGSLLKGALDIYGTTNRLLIAYPVIAVLTIIAAVILSKRGESKTPGGPAIETAE